MRQTVSSMNFAYVTIWRTHNYIHTFIHLHILIFFFFRLHRYEIWFVSFVFLDSGHFLRRVSAIRKFHCVPKFMEIIKKYIDLSYFIKSSQNGEISVRCYLQSCFNIRTSKAWHWLVRKLILHVHTFVNVVYIYFKRVAALVL